METPDKWVILKIEHDGNTFYKVFASWFGGYLGSNSWRMNSGIVSVKNFDLFFEFIGYSGSVYKCFKGTYGTHLYSRGVLNNIIEKAIDAQAVVTVMPEDTDWVELFEK